MVSSVTDESNQVSVIATTSGSCSIKICSSSRVLFTILLALRLINRTLFACGKSDACQLSCSGEGTSLAE